MKMSFIRGALFLVMLGMWYFAGWQGHRAYESWFSQKYGSSDLIVADDAVIGSIVKLIIPEKFGLWCGVAVGTETRCEVRDIFEIRCDRGEKSACAKAMPMPTVTPKQSRRTG